jgi:hypothetical protein
MKLDREISWRHGAIVYCIATPIVTLLLWLTRGY